MKKLIFCAASVAALTFNAVARELPPEVIEQGKKNMEIFLRETGGFLGDRRTAQGSVAVVDAQKSVPADFLRTCAKRVELTLLVAVNYTNFNGAVSFGNLADAFKVGNGTLAVIVTEDPAMPALVSLPEQRSVLVNVTALKKDAPDEAKLRSRIAKEISRAVCFAFVIKYSGKPGGIMDPIQTLPDLDRILVDQIGVESKPHIEKSGLQTFGIKRMRRVTYLDACQQGWAPPPANAVQSNVWEKAHSIPEKPLKITYDAEKQTSVVK